MNNTILIFILINLLVISIGVNIYLKNRKTPKLNINQSSFIKDSEYLFFIIESKIQNSRQMFLEPLELTYKNAFLNDKLLDSQTEDLIKEIYLALSDDYKEVLYKYFTKDSLLEFIIENVFKEISKTIMEINNKKIKRSLMNNKDNYKMDNELK
jgi:hypothetical protein